VPRERLEDLIVFQRSVAAADAISALVERSPIRRDFTLRDQLFDSSGSLPANISEGHGQGSDRHFAHFLYIARGSSKEVRAHLRVAPGRNYITNAEYNDYCRTFDEIAAMLTGLIRHLERNDGPRR
jgi:four helix bundle protein